MQSLGLVLALLIVKRDTTPIVNGAFILRFSGMVSSLFYIFSPH